MPLRALDEIQAHVSKAQSSMTRLTYEAHHPSLDKQRVGAQGMHKIDQVGRNILRKDKPIQCLEAVMVAAHLTTRLPVHRLPLSFTTRVLQTGQTHKHIVLALTSESHQRWGAMGMSRSSELMDKALIFASFSALVEEYQRSYSMCGHILESVLVGLPFSSKASCTLPVVWQALNIDLKAQGEDKRNTPSSVPSTWKAVLDHYGQSVQALLAFHQRHPDSNLSSSRLYASLQGKKARLCFKDLLIIKKRGERRPGGWLWSNQHGEREGREEEESVACAFPLGCMI